MVEQNTIQRTRYTDMLRLYTSSPPLGLYKLFRIKRTASLYGNKESMSTNLDNKMDFQYNAGISITQSNRGES
jgi:hypothetical protein